LLHLHQLLTMHGVAKGTLAVHIERLSLLLRHMWRREKAVVHMRRLLLLLLLLLIRRRLLRLTVVTAAMTHPELFPEESHVFHGFDGVRNAAGVLELDEGEILLRRLLHRGQRTYLQEEFEQQLLRHAVFQVPHPQRRVLVVAHDFGLIRWSSLE